MGNFFQMFWSGYVLDQYFSFVVFFISHFFNILYHIFIKKVIVSHILQISFIFPLVDYQTDRWTKKKWTDL